MILSVTTFILMLLLVLPEKNAIVGYCRLLSLLLLLLAIVGYCYCCYCWLLLAAVVVEGVVVAITVVTVEGLVMAVVDVQPMVVLSVCC